MFLLIETLSIVNVHYLSCLCNGPAEKNQKILLLIETRVCSSGYEVLLCAQGLLKALQKSHFERWALREEAMNSCREVPLTISLMLSSSRSETLVKRMQDAPMFSRFPDSA